MFFFLPACLGSGGRGTRLGFWRGTCMDGGKGPDDELGGASWVCPLSQIVRLAQKECKCKKSTFQEKEKTDSQS